MSFLAVISLFALALLLCREISEYERRRLKTADALLSMLRHIKTMILCFSMPLDEIYRALRDSTLESLGFLPILRETKDLGAALRQKGASLVLSEDLRLRLAELGDALGRGDRRGAGELCDYYIDELAHEAGRLRLEGPKRTKLWRSLVISGMLMLVIAFI